MQGNLLLVGHANGDVSFWEFKRTGWEAVKAFKDAHAGPVTSATFVEGGPQIALTGDALGRLVSHNVTAYLSITAIFAGQLLQRTVYGNEGRGNIIMLMTKLSMSPKSTFGMPLLLGGLQIVTMIVTMIVTLQGM